MARITLDCVDEAAGDETIFLTDRKAATKKMMTKLRPPVTDQQNYARLTQKKIFNKLGALATSGGVQKGGFREFLQIGTTCLDLSKLQPDTYSQAEIHASSQHHQNNDRRGPPVSNTRNASKKEASEIENKSSKAKKLDAQHKKGEDPNKRPKRPHSSAFSHDQEHAQVPAKRKRTTINPPTHNDEISDSQSSANEDDDDYAEDFEDASEEFQRDSQRRSARDPSIISRVQAPTQVQTQAVYVCEVCDQYFHAKKDLLAHKLSHEKSSPRRNISQSSFQASTTDKMPTLTPGDFKLLEMATRRIRGEHTDVDAIKSAMANIQVEIYDATKLFLMNLKIDGNETIELRVDSYQDQLNGLLRSVFGSGLVDRLARSPSVRCPSVSGIKRCDIVLAVIGCAVTNWALRPLPQGEVRDGVLGEMNKILQAHSPVFQDKVMEMAIHQYLEKHVKPLAPGFAQVFAHDLFHLLGHFLPGELKEDSSQLPSEIHDMRTDTSSGQNTITPDNVPREVSVATTSHSSSAHNEQQTLSVATVEESRTNLTSKSELTSGQPIFSEPTGSESTLR